MSENTATERKYISAVSMLKRRDLQQPTLYIDVRPASAYTATFSILANKFEPTHPTFGGVRLNIAELETTDEVLSKKALFEKIEKWCKDNPDYLIVLGCTVSSLRSAGVAAMYDYLQTKGMNVAAINDNHYTLFNVEYKPLPRLTLL